MSYVAIDVQIEHGKIVAAKHEELPQSGSGVLILFQDEPPKPNGKGSSIPLIAPPTLIAENWDSLGPAPEIDYGKL